MNTEINKNIARILAVTRTLEEAMLVIDDYLNAGSKSARKKASTRAKSLYKKYHGVDYVNKNERK